MKSTLKRESKALEIVEIDTFVVSDLFSSFVFGFFRVFLKAKNTLLCFDKHKIITGDSGLTPVTIKAVLHFIIPN